MVKIGSPLHIIATDHMEFYSLAMLFYVKKNRVLRKRQIPRAHYTLQVIQRRFQ